MIHSRLAKLATIAAALAAFTGAVHAQEALKIAIMDIEKSVLHTGKPKCQ